MSRHDFHGEWNYTLHPLAPLDTPHTPDIADVGEDHRAAAYHPALIGMTPDALTCLTPELTSAWNQQLEARRHDRRGGERRHALGGGGVAKLELTDRIVAGLLHLRFSMLSPLVGQLLGVSRITAARAIKHVLPLLERRGRTAMPSGGSGRYTPSAPITC